MRDATVSRSASTTRAAAKSTNKKVTIPKVDDSASSADTGRVSTPEQRHSMISEAAYYIAEKSGFNPSLTDSCWTEAEKQIDSKLLEF